MPAETKQCKNCSKEFVVQPEDFDFYKKINVPPPTWCPGCRNMRRMAWREEKTFYRDTCKLCGKAIVSIRAPGGPFTTYCRPCWKSDKWDPMNYGREYDFSKPFFAQYRALMEAVPWPALTGEQLVNSDFTHACQGAKDCYNLYWSFMTENSENSAVLLLSKNVYDGYVVDNSDHAYESLHSNRLYRVRYGYFADDCLEASFLYDCLGCSDCFGCINLRKQKYCLWNKQLTKEEYRQAMASFDLGSYANLEEAKSKFKELYLSVPHRFAHAINVQNATGDIMRDAKDCKACFSTLDGVEHCRYIYVGGLGLKDSWDVSGGGNMAELLYEAMGVTGNASRCFFSSGDGTNNQDVWYSDFIRNGMHAFGCIGLRNKKYCILNKQYTKEEYEDLVPKIKEHMQQMPYVDAKGREYGFGEFFPTEISAFAYNTSFAFAWYPRTKAEVLAEGWRWQDPEKRDYEPTKRPEGLPDHIRDAPEDIVNDIIQCGHADTGCNEQCTRAFRISAAELSFYRNMSVALPRLCPNCRQAERLTWRNGFDLYHRRCMCPAAGEALAGDKGGYRNVAKHSHGDAPCPNEFETTFAPERPEIVYCDACYKSEFL